MTSTWRTTDSILPQLSNITPSPMTTKILFFLFPLLLILQPIFLYKKDRPGIVAIWYRLAFDNNSLKMTANLLALVVIFFHLSYYAVFPNDMGIMLSTLFMFFLLSTKNSVRLLLSIRRNKYSYMALALITILILFIPHTLPTAYTFAAILECASFFPATGLEDLYQNNFDEEDLDRKFVNAYFS